MKKYFLSFRPAERKPRTYAFVTAEYTASAVALLSERYPNCASIAIHGTSPAAEDAEKIVEDINPHTI